MGKGEGDVRYGQLWVNDEERKVIWKYWKWTRVTVHLVLFFFFFQKQKSNLQLWPIRTQAKVEREKVNAISSTQLGVNVHLYWIWTCLFFLLFPLPSSKMTIPVMTFSLTMSVYPSFPNNKNRTSFLFFFPFTKVCRSFPSLQKWKVHFNAVSDILCLFMHAVAALVNGRQTVGKAPGWGNEKTTNGGVNKDGGFLVVRPILGRRTEGIDYPRRVMGNPVLKPSLTLRTLIRKSEKFNWVNIF